MTAAIPSLPMSLALALLGGATALARSPEATVKYPKPPVTSQIDDYHGVKVADPYRKLEDPDAPETRVWIEGENKVTNAYLDAMPDRKQIRERLTKLWNYERFSAPFQEGGRYFYSKNDGLQNQAVLYVMEKLGGEPRVLLDPNTLSKDGTIALAGTVVSHDGRHLAYGTSASGSDWNEWRVRDITTGEDTVDHLKWVKFSSAAWTRDDKGFYYSRYDAPAGHELEAVNKDQKLYYHRLGTPQSEDTLTYARADDPELGFGANVSEDGRYLVVFVWKGTDRRNRLYFKDLSAPGSDFVRLFDAFDASYSFIGNDGPTFYIQTDLDAPRKRVVSVNVSDFVPGQAPKLTELIPQSDGVINSVGIVADRFVVQLMKDASERVRLYRLDGTFDKEIELPALGSVGGLDGKRADKETFYAFTSFTYPTTTFRYDFTTGKSELFRQPKVDFDPAAYETKLVFYPSKDGTKIPLFLVYKKGLKLDGRNPTYLYGYGGFNIPLTPSFSVSRLAWIERGGVYAQAGLRGGSEYGEDWHRGGMLDKKQNVFDDFAAAAQWLIANKYSTANRIGILGGSNGGLLVGATLNQHPELFGAAVPAVGVMDMLRFHKFTIGWGWTSDYGSADDAEQFKTLYAYSPIHNIKKGTKYPPVLITTADHDDRVVPAHSFKYAATMQAAQGGKAPILIRIETKAGHGAGKPTSKQIDESADVLGFLWKNLAPRPSVLKRAVKPAA
ncbi:MAG: prolyl oligopeptidase family serine peptidase [Thermoanaerobaculia bacterium]